MKAIGESPKQPTPETDNKYANLCDKWTAGLISDLEMFREMSDFARKLERERDEARQKRDELKQQLCNRPAVIERDQLRKVCDELAKQIRICSAHGPQTLLSYYSLHHVVERNKSK